MSALRLLVVNADDLGFTRDVNEGILEAHLHGIVTAATLMATGAAFDHAVDLAHAHPSLDVGVHLTLVGARSALDPDRELPASPSKMAVELLTGRLSPYEEFSAQVRRIRGAGLEISHADTHKHTHLLPPVAEAMARVCAEFGIPWVRRPLGIPALSPWICARFRRAGLRLTGSFVGYRQTGSLDERSLAELIRALPAGSSELMCHPGRVGEELRSARTRLKESRQRELESLTSKAVRDVIKETGVILTNYRELGRDLS